MNAAISSLVPERSVRPDPHRQPVAIAFDQVSKGFRSHGRVTQALENVSLEVRRGAFVSLVGPSGSGKTTLLNLAAGLLRADAGRLEYGGANLTGPNTQVGYLTQDDALLPWRSVLANVALPLEVRGVGRPERLAAARRIIARVGLKDFEKHFPAQLSGGMRKRVALARTLVYHPETLLLDEPFSALDAQTRLVIQKQLRELVGELGLTVLLVTHDLHEAIALSDTIVVFSRRPARILETFEVPQPAGRDILRPRAADEQIYLKIWDLLADDSDLSDA
jgi:NitT/TauT family transport system ATP-binding protein